MRVLVVGQGGREHALATFLGADPAVERVYAAPGNAGIEEVAACYPVAAADVGGLVDLAVREAFDLVVVGPEAPLVAGLADVLGDRSIPVFGPTADGSRIEGSKAWAKDLCERHGIPVPRSRAFTELDAAVRALDDLGPPYVVKADGLAGGKGVTVAPDRPTAEAALRASLVDRAFGAAGERVLVEEFLEGREVSVLALTDGRSVVPLEPARDHKRLLDGDGGPNTGGMGAYSPVPFVDAPMQARIVREVLEPTIRALRSEGIEYRGVLYAGLMLTDDGPKVLEFNCRFGDPETQAVLPRLHAGLAETLAACAGGDLGDLGGRRLGWRDAACVTVVLAAAGYPGEPRSGDEIDGLEAAKGLPDVWAFHAGTVRRGGRVATAGGRVLSVSALGADLAGARARAYEASARIRFEGMHHRTDIAADVMEGARG
jgi:phosphoribosylamine---glycine ligase